MDDDDRLELGLPSYLKGYSSPFIRDLPYLKGNSPPCKRGRGRPPKVKLNER